MSLRNLLFSFLVCLFLALLGLNLLSAVQNYRSYLQNQLQAHAQDAATSLGIVLTTAVAEGDKATAERMIDAVFDRGYYQRIEYLDTNGKVQVVRQTGRGVEDLPGWFVRYADLPAPLAEAHVTSGWLQLGLVKVQGHPAQAYHDLWSYLVKVSLQFGGALLVAFILLHVLLSWAVLKPLHVLELHAKAWAERRFSPIKMEPTTRELGSLVGVMNKMVQRLESMFSDQLGVIDHLRHQVCEDPLTGLLNRSAFDERLRSLLTLREEGARSGLLVLVQVRGLEDFNKRFGREAGDDVLKRLAVRLQESTDQNDALVCRRTGTDFAVFVPGIAQDQAADTLRTLFQHLVQLEVMSESIWRDRLHLGGVYLYPQEAFELGAAFSEADLALRQAQQEGLNACHLATPQEHARSASEWRQFLEGVIARNELLLYYQPVYDGQRKLLHHEVYVRVQDSQGVLAAGQFLPMAEQFGLMPALDRQVLQLLINNLSLSRNQGKFCVNLSLASWQDEGLVSWMKSILASHPQVAKQLLLEVPEFALRQYQSLIQGQMERLRSLGIGFSVDHFGTGGVAFSYLKLLPLSCVKVHRSFVKDIQAKRDSQFFMLSMAQIAHGQDILLLAEGIEHEGEWEQLQTLGVDGGMGYLLGRPQAVPIKS
ncbi:EAL domain-containing protein [Balneatrix alpica]|uniref:EAL domain-containing protein n=1 Tax=Balneatrix alpica TaxID=75684 RepID=A0ABV5ZD44_9GAMM|nr:EAL domain-containing protein [Balneatrix alpica]